MKKRKFKLLSIAIIALLAIPQNTIAAVINNTESNGKTIYYLEKNGVKQIFTEDSQGTIIPDSTYNTQTTMSTNSNTNSNLATNNEQNNLLKDQLVQQSLTKSSELIYDDASPFLKYTGKWTNDINDDNEGGTAKLLNSSGNVSFSFTGSSVKWTGFKDPKQGIGRVVIDGVTQAEVNLYAKHRGNKQLLFEKSLNFGKHVMEIQWAGTPDKHGKVKKNDPGINIDTIKINTSAPQVTAPIITSSIGHASNISLTFKNNDESAEQLYVYKSTAGSNFTLLSTYNSSDSKNQEFLLEDTDVLNNVIYNYYVTAVNTTGESVPSNTVTTSKLTTNSVYTLENTNSNIAYTGTWNSEPTSTYSGGSSHVTVETGSKVSIPFTAFESRIKLMSGPDMGIARIHWSNSNGDYYDANLNAPNEDYWSFGTSSNMQTSSNWVIECLSGKIVFDVEEIWDYTTTAPISPTNLNGVLANNNVSLNWNANTELDLKGYNIYRSTTEGSDYSLLNPAPIPNAQFTDTSIIPEEDYYYIVKAVNYANLESTSSNEITITDAIATPTGLTGTLSGTSSVLNWTQHTDPIATQYNIYRSTTSGSDYQLLNTILNPDLTYTDSTVVAGNTYYYAISAVSITGTESVKSNEVTVVVPQVITAPIGLIGTLLDTSAVLNWTMPSDPVVTQYNVYRSTTSGSNYQLLNTVSNPILTYTDSTVVAGTTYYYAISAVSSTAVESVKSNEVTVVMATTVPISGENTQRFEEINSNIAYTGTWVTGKLSSYSGGTVQSSNITNSYLEFAFTGTGIKWISCFGTNRGKAKVYIDGTLISTIDTYSALLEPQKVAFQKLDLSPGSHIIKIVVTGTKNSASIGGYITVDAFDVLLLPSDEVIPIIPEVPANGKTTQLFEEINSNIAYTGTWVTGKLSSYSGGTVQSSNVANSYLEFAFTGTGIRWISCFGTNRGKAKVYVDGNLISTVDTYSALPEPQKVAFEKLDLSSGSHIIKIVVTGTKNPASIGGYITVDAFDVLLLSSDQVIPIIPEVPANGKTTQIFEEINSNIAYTGTWVTGKLSSYSGGTVQSSNVANSYLEFAFTGTGIKWISCFGTNRGKAKVYIDGNLISTVDTYSALPEPQKVAFEKLDLSSGSHIIKIVVTGTKNSASIGGYITVDAFDVLLLPSDEVIPIIPEVPASEETTQIFEEINSNITYTGTWVTGKLSSYSGGTVQSSNVANSYLEFTFTGTGIRWISYLSTNRGKAKVYIDDNLISTIDTYSALLEPQKVAFEKLDLSSGSHIIKIVVTGTKNSASIGGYITVDAFNVLN